MSDPATSRVLMEDEGDTTSEDYQPAHTHPQSPDYTSAHPSHISTTEPPSKPEQSHDLTTKLPKQGKPPPLRKQVTVVDPDFSEVFCDDYTDSQTKLMGDKVSPIPMPNHYPPPQHSKYCSEGNISQRTCSDDSDQISQIRDTQGVHNGTTHGRISARNILPKKYLRQRQQVVHNSPPEVRHRTRTRQPCVIKCCSRTCRWPKMLTWSRCCQQKEKEDDFDIPFEEEPFRKRCFRACFTFVYVLLATVAVVVTYSMVQDLITSMNNPVRSIHYKKVTDYEAPG